MATASIVRASCTWSKRLPGCLRVRRDLSVYGVARVSRYVPLLPKYMFIKVGMGCAALLSTRVSCFGSWLQNGANCGLRVFMYTGWVVSCARHLLWDADENQQLWCFSLVLCATIISLNLSVFSGSQANADSLTRLILIAKFIQWITVLIANSLRPKMWRRFFSHSPGRVNMARVLIKYNPPTRALFATKVCLARERKL